MKIVFIGGRDIRSIGGIENYMLNLASQLVKMGHSPIVFCESDKNDEITINGFKVFLVKGPKNPLICKPYVSFIATIKSTFFFKNVDLIHYNAWPPSLWCFIPRIRGICSLMQGHGLEWQRSKYSPFQQKIMKFMEFVTAHINKNLIMCSEDQSKYFASHYNRKAFTIPTAINLPLTDSTSMAHEQYLSKYGVVSKGYFIYMARLVQDKNPHYLIKAFNQIKNCNYKLLICGDNPADKNFVRYLQVLATDNPSIIFAGAVYGEEKNVLMKNAYAFCIPSTIEGLSISLLEAMSLRIPIIASNISANREVLDAKCAIWVKPEDINSLADGLKVAINNHRYLNEMIEPNYEKVRQKYTWDNVACKYISYVNKITKNA